jgi:hypothetical protein
VSVGELVSRSFSVWWSHLFKFGALTLLVIVPPIGLVIAAGYAAIGAATGDPQALAAGWRGPVLMGIAAFTVTLLGMVVQMGALTYGAVQHLAGRPVRFGPMLAAGFRRALPLVGVGSLACAMVMAGVLLFIVPGIIVAIAVGVAIPAVVVEKIGPVAAIRRSFDLTRDHRFTLFLTSLVVGLAVSAANMAMQLAVVVLGELGTVAALFGSVLYLLVAALPMLVPAVAYHELRAAKEGIVTEELVKVFE